MGSSPLLCAVAAALTATMAGAAAITPDEPVDLIVPGTASLYEIFGHKGDPGGELPGQASSPAAQLDFTPGPRNRFAFSVTGRAGCCAPEPASYPPDGGRRPDALVAGANGLSDAAGDTALGLLGAFTSSADPAISPAPATRPWDADAPRSLAPLLQQTFYIGDGRSGYDDTVGSTLLFTAPPDASRLYLGLADALRWGGPPGFYGDNPGSYSVRTLLVQQAVAEPSVHALTVLVFAALVAALRVRRSKDR
jgi:hypothetical protein